MKRLLGLLIAANLLVLAVNSPKLLSVAVADITAWSTTAASNTSAIGTEGMSENAHSSTVNDAYRAGLAELAKLARQGVLSTFAPEGGTANAYYITPALVPNSAISGQRFSFKAGSTNTGASTLRVGSLSAKTIKKISNQDLAAGDIVAGGVYTVTDDGTNYQLSNFANTLISAGSISTYQITNAAITLSLIAPATSGNILIWNTGGNADVVTPGIVGQVLTSRGPNSTPIYQTPVTASLVRGTAMLQNPIVLGGSVLQGHGLSGVPDILDAALVNITAECGYGAGDMLAWPTLQIGGNVGFSVVRTTTALRLETGSAAQVPNKTTGADCAATAANWYYIVTPYKINL